MKSIDRSTDADKRKQKMGRAAVRKGKRGEKEGADFCTDGLVVANLDDLYEVIRRSQYKGGRWRPEVGIVPKGDWHSHLIHFEWKRREKCSMRAAVKQACQDCQPGAIPIGVTHQDREIEYGTLPLQQLWMLIVSWLKENTEGQDDLCECQRDNYER